MPSIHVKTARLRRKICFSCPNYNSNLFVCNLDKQNINKKIFLNNCPERKWPIWEYKEPEVKQNKKTKEPSLLKKAKTLTQAMVKWAKSGFLKASKKQINERLEICKGCEFWDSRAWNGTGKCTKCGCSTYAKLRLKTEKCPIGKW